MKQKRGLESHGLSASVGGGSKGPSGQPEMLTRTLGHESLCQLYNWVLPRGPPEGGAREGRLVIIAKSWGVSGKGGVFRSQRAATDSSSGTIPWKVTISHILWGFLSSLAISLDLRYQDGSNARVCL